MDSTEPVDPYLDPETGLLRNKVGARTRTALDEAEGDLSFARLVQLMDRPVRPTGDLDELRAIHRHLFQDIYDWAGQLRTVDIRKSVEGAQFFLPVSMIERAAVFAERELRADNMLCGMSRDHFIERLAYHYDSFNYIHPFREGNGRTSSDLVVRDAEPPVPRGQRSYAASVLDPHCLRCRVAAGLARRVRLGQRQGEQSRSRETRSWAAARYVQSGCQRDNPAGRTRHLLARRRARPSIVPKERRRSY